MKKVRRQYDLDSTYVLGWGGDFVDAKKITKNLDEAQVYAKRNDLILKVKLEGLDSEIWFDYQFYKEESDIEYQARLEQEKEQERYEREIKEVQDKALLKELILKYGSPN